MAQSPYAYFRGAAGAGERDPARRPIPLGRGADRIGLVGDPHPENLGAFRDRDGRWTLEWNDFDRARTGRFEDDVRRLGVGFFVAADLAGLGRSKRGRVVRKMARGYADEIAAQAAGRPGIDVRPRSGFGRIADDLFAEAARAASDPLEVDRGASVAADPRRLFERAIASAAPGSSVVGVRFVRAGIASWANLRWRVRLEGASPDPSDDVVVEVKEIRGRDPDRVVAAERAIHRRELDPFLAAARVDGIAFAVRSWPPWRASADVDRVAAQMRNGTWKYRDLRTFAWVAGRLLARAHAPSDAAPARAILRAMRDPDAFVDAIVGACDEDGERTLRDFQLFRALHR